MVMARKQILTLPGEPGTTAFCDASSGLRELLGAMAGGMAARSLALFCAAGAGVGKMLNPSVRQFNRQFRISGELTCKPGKRMTFRCFKDGHVPEHQELTTISCVRVTF